MHPGAGRYNAIAAVSSEYQAEAVRALYGEDIPLISLFLGFGKPVIAPELLPPLLGGAVNCYWSQRPGYQFSEAEFRRILYDHAFVRSTWQADKSGRGEEALATALPGKQARCWVWACALGRFGIPSHLPCRPASK